MSSLITNATIQIRKDTAGNWTSNNPTPAAGEWCKETDTGNLKQGDGSTAWTALGYNISLPETYNIASANTVIALPDITGSVQRKTYYWTAGDGSNTFSFTVSDASTIGGIAATLWLGEGAGHISIESDGSNWQVREYEDSGSNANGEWKKELDGSMRESGVISGTTTTIQSNTFGSTAGSLYFLNQLTNPFPKVFISNPSISASFSTSVSHILHNELTTSTYAVQLQSTANSIAITGNWIAVGRWRT